MLLYCIYQSSSVTRPFDKMVLYSKFVLIVLVVLATEMDVSVTSSDLKVKQFCSTSSSGID